MGAFFFYLSLGGLSPCPGPPPREPCIWLFSSEGFRVPGSRNRGILVAVASALSEKS